MEHATGWPVLAGWYGVTATFQTNAYVLNFGGAIKLPATHARRRRFGLPDASSIRALPLHPIWPGLLIDTAFYATLWLIPLGGLRTARRAYRRSRNRCPNCAYDLAGLSSPENGDLTCPECGRKQKPHRIPHPL